MENKTTSELLDLIGKYSVKERNKKEISDKECDDYVDAIKELQQRAPFSLLFNSEDNYYSEEKPSFEERLDEIEENFNDFEKKIKRHKHDERSGDVMLRI